MMVSGVVTNRAYGEILLWTHNF